MGAALRQFKPGIPAVELCRRFGVHENTMWRKKCGSVGTPGVRELRQLREENILKKLVADLTLE
ncbi:MAG: transposase [Candidatus Cybelea sp.]